MRPSLFFHYLFSGMRHHPSCLCLLFLVLFAEFSLRVAAGRASAEGAFFSTDTFLHLPSCPLPQSPVGLQCVPPPITQPTPPSFFHSLPQAAEALLERSRKEGLGHWAYSSTAAPQPSIDQWAGWAGMHSPTPAVVPGLSGVQQVALGSFHALALLR